MNRREFLTRATAAGIASRPAFAGPLLAPPTQGPLCKLSIEKVAHEIAPGLVIPTVGYNGTVPGPLLRMPEGRPVTIDVTNKTDVPELVHWHGLAIDPLNDGAMEEGSPMIPPHGHLRYTFTPKPVGSRWYHTHAMAGTDFTRAAYSGQFGFLYVEPKQDPHQYDHEYFLQIHHWDASLIPMMLMPSVIASDDNAPKPQGIEVTGCDIAYKHATINGKKLGHGEPIRVFPKQRIMLRILNASATKNVTLALPGHTFRVVAMDGNQVPRPTEVETLQIALAERMDVLVEMNSPGVWTLGSIDDAERQSGLGIVIEYAGHKGPPVWKSPATTEWDYSLFASPTAAAEADKRFSILTRMIAPTDGSKAARWTLNGQSWPKIDPLTVEKGKRYRLSFVNSSTCAHPMHLHRHSFEVTRIGRKHMSGLIKDVINVPAGSIAEVDFIADNPGDSLMHCHQQLHMDYGFMQLIKYA